MIGELMNKRGKEVGYLSLLGDIQKVVPCSDADKPVGSCGAWRGVCYNRKRQVCTCFYIYTHTNLTLVSLLQIDKLPQGLCYSFLIDELEKDSKG